MSKLISLLSLSFLFSFSPISSAHNLMAAIQSEDRSPKNVVRDEFRNPAETLTFFQIKPDMRVVELSPGGGWYTEILANYLHEPGILIAAHFDKDSEVSYFKRGRANFEKKIASSPMYSNVEIVDLNSNLAEENSVDAVVTFRNLHNWLGPQMDSIFANSFKALKPGGIFGVVEHRADPGTSLDDMKKSGYVTEEHAIMTLDPTVALDIGDTVRIIPNHACAVMNLFDRAYGLRDGKLVEEFKIAARGKVH